MDVLINNETNTVSNERRIEMDCLINKYSRKRLYWTMIFLFIGSVFLVITAALIFGMIPKLVGFIIFVIETIVFVLGQFRYAHLLKKENKLRKEMGYPLVIS